MVKTKAQIQRKTQRKTEEEEDANKRDDGEQQEQKIQCTHSNGMLDL